MPQSHHTRLTDRDAVVSALADLAAHREEVALRLPDTRHSTMFFVDSVDAERGQIVFESVPEAAEPGRFDTDCAPVLHARRRAGHLSSSPMVCDAVEQDPGSGRLVLRCRLPQALLLRHARNYWRASVVTDEMVVSVRVSRQAGTALEAVLVDLSVGGCRVSLTAGDAELPEIGERVAVTLTFPNGEATEVVAELRQIEYDREPVRMGLAFVDVDAELSRRLWFYTCEIDREAVRRRQLRDEMRRLAPSRLFRPAGLRDIGPNME